MKRVSRILCLTFAFWAAAGSAAEGPDAAAILRRAQLRAGHERAG
jgi:hypothetical protein